MSSSQLTFIFFRGVGIPPTSINLTNHQGLLVTISQISFSADPTPIFAPGILEPQRTRNKWWFPQTTLCYVRIHHYMSLPKGHNPWNLLVNRAPGFSCLPESPWQVHAANLVHCDVKILGGSPRKSRRVSVQPHGDVAKTCRKWRKTPGWTRSEIAKLLRTSNLIEKLSPNDDNIYIYIYICDIYTSGNRWTEP